GMQASSRKAYAPCCRSPLPPRRRSIRTPTDAAKSFADARSNVCSAFMHIGSVAPGIWIAYAAVLCILVAGSGATRVLGSRFPERDYTELRLRVRTWWLIV